jgi:hypothetical protein
MIVVVLSHRIAGLNESNVMPIWWHTSRRRRQLPSGSSMRCDFNLSDLRTKCPPQSKNSMCPPYTVPKKGGRPREEKGIKTLVKKAIEKKKEEELSVKKKLK